MSRQSHTAKALPKQVALLTSPWSKSLRPSQYFPVRAFAGMRLTYGFAEFSLAFGGQSFAPAS